MTVTWTRSELGDAVRKLYRTDPDQNVYEGIALQIDALWEMRIRHAHTAANTAVSVYPVGMMAILLSFRAAVAHRRLGYFVWRWHARNFAHGWRRRSFWNGFLAEVDYPPDGLIHSRAGSGWTRRRAARDLGYQLWLDNSGQRR